MFDIGWSELLVVAVVLVVVVGPKDLPGMLRTFGRTTKQLRSMAGDFRRQFDDALREAELDDVKSTVDEMRKLDPRKNIRDVMNPMRAIGDEIRSSLSAATKSEQPKVPSAEANATASEPDKGSVSGTASASEPSWWSQDAMTSRVAEPAGHAVSAPAPTPAESSNFPNGRPAEAARVAFSPARSKWSSSKATSTVEGASDAAPERPKSGDAA